MAKKNKKNKKIVAKKRVKLKAKKIRIASPKKNKAAWETAAHKLLAKGKERGFITYDEILKEFPHIESDVFFFGRALSALA